MSSIANRLARIKEELQDHIQRGEWCDECGYGLQLVILTGDEPEPLCNTCNRPKARGEGIRVIRICEREDGPR